jgi:hypothetical protein
MQSKPGSRGSALGLDLDDEGSVGGREPVLSAKLMDDEPDVIVRLAIAFLPFICSPFGTFPFCVFNVCFELVKVTKVTTGGGIYRHCTVQVQPFRSQQQPLRR